MDPEIEGQGGTATATETDTSSQHEAGDAGSQNAGEQATGEQGQQGAKPEGEQGKPGDQKPGLKLPESLKPKPTGRFQQRISDLVQARKTAEDEARRLRDEVAQLRGSNQPGSVRTKGAAAESTGAVDLNAELQPENFPTYAQYVQAVVDQQIARRDAAKQQQSTKESYETYRAEKQEEFQTHAAPLAEAYGPDFWDAITDESLPVSEAMADAVMELGEMGPYTMLWLAANKQEAARMFKLNPRQATIEVGRLAAKLTMELQQATTADGQQAPPVSSAAATNPSPFGTRPRPSVVPTPRGSAPANDLDGTPSDKDDPTTWLKKETERLRKKFGPNVRFYGA